MHAMRRDLEEILLTEGQIQRRLDYATFRIRNKFVVGCGLDYRERYRNLPYIGTLRAEAIAATL